MCFFSRKAAVVLGIICVYDLRAVISERAHSQIILWFFRQRLLLHPLPCNLDCILIVLYIPEDFCPEVFSPSVKFRWIFSPHASLSLFWLLEYDDKFTLIGLICMALGNTWHQCAWVCSCLRCEGPGQPCGKQCRTTAEELSSNFK